MVRVSHSMRLSLAILALLYGADGGVAAAQDDPDDNSIVVRGMSEEEAERAVRDLSREVTRDRRFGEQMPRFQSPVCVLVYGLPRKNAVALVARVRANAERVGLQVGEDGCEPNIVIGVVEDSEAAVSLLREEKPWLFDSLREYEIERDLGAGRSARAWHVIEETLASGREIDVGLDLEVGNSNPSETEAGTGAPISADTDYATRFRPPTQAVIARGVVLLEYDAILGLQTEQVADYASMRMFASVDDAPIEGDEPLDTILSLFSDPERAPAELTQFDLAYLQALYSTGRNAGDAALSRAASRAYHRNVFEGE